MLLCYDRKNLDRFVAGLCEKLGLTLENFDPACSVEYHSWSRYQEMLPSLARSVVERGAGAGIVFEPNADRLILIDDKGRVIQDD